MFDDSSYSAGLTNAAALALFDNKRRAWATLKTLSSQGNHCPPHLLRSAFDSWMDAKERSEQYEQQLLLSCLSEDEPYKQAHTPKRKPPEDF